MDAIELLESQHREVEKLFSELEGLSDRAMKSRLRLFTELADALALHTVLEEKIFYPSVNLPETKDLLLESLEEHLAVKRVITDLMKCEPADTTWKAKVSVLKEDVQHHVKEEEEGLFPKVQQLLSEEQLDRLGEQMQEMAARLKGKHLSKKVPAETAHAAPLKQMHV